jgi:Protein of unknown function (DUF1640)
MMKLSTSAWRPAAHFDTFALVSRLEASGMPKQQADVLAASLADVIGESIDNLARGLVSREEGEKWRYTQKVRHGNVMS